jgi:hypothetical protein
MIIAPTVPAADFANPDEAPRDAAAAQTPAS